MLFLLFRTATPLLVAMAMCLVTTGCGWNELSDTVNQWLGKTPPQSATKPAPAQASNTTEPTPATPGHGIALPPEIPSPHAVALNDTSPTDPNDLHADPVLMDTATSEALALGLADAQALQSPSWQAAPLTQGQLAQWLARWVEPQKSLPTLPAIKASPFTDVPLDSPQLSALRVATSAHWLLLPGSTAPTPDTPIAIAPDTPISVSDVLAVVLRAQQWIQQDGHPAIAAPVTPQTLHTEATETGLTDTLFGQPLTQQQFVQAIQPPATQLQGLMIMAFWL